MVEQELLTLPDHPVFSGGHFGHDHNQIWKSRCTQVYVNKYKLNIYLVKHYPSQNKWEYIGCTRKIVVDIIAQN
jgi:hypothetical protein